MKKQHGARGLRSPIGQGITGGAMSGQSTLSTHLTCFLTLLISACSLWMVRLSSVISILLLFRSSPCLPAVIWSSWY